MKLERDIPQDPLYDINIFEVFASLLLIKMSVMGGSLGENVTQSQLWLSLEHAI